jgi:hypothetical protein
MRRNGGFTRGLAVPVFLSCTLAGAGCGNSSSESSNAALVVGAASGPIFDELASAYRVSFGDGSESPDHYAVAIYDGRSLSPEEIEALPSTDAFLGAGKILIVLEPDVEDLQALQGELGAVPLVETPAAAVFKTYSADHWLQNATLIEFPTTQTENPSPPQTADGAEAVASGPGSDQRVAVDDATLRSHARQWRELFEREHVDAARAMGSDAGSSAERIDVATATADTPPEAVRDEAPDWLLAPDSIPPAGSSQYWTVRQFTHTRPVMLQITSALYDPANQGIKRDGSAAIQRGLCFFIPDGSTFELKPVAPSTATVLVTHVVNRMLRETNPGEYQHNVILRQFVRTSPTVLRPGAEPIGTETVQFCRALASNNVPPLGWYCVENGFGCNAFKEPYPLQSLLGFNAQVKSRLTWDPTSARLLSINSMRPVAANNVTTISTSENWSVNLNFAISGALEIESVPPSVGVSGPGAGGGVDWGWSSAQTINVKDWETRPISSGATAEHDLFAAAGGNSLANLAKFTTGTGQGVLSFTTLTGLQESFLEARTETSWITTSGLLPAGKSTLTSQVDLAYGEVYDRYSAVNLIDPPAPLPYGAVHPFTVTVPFEIDFSSPVLQAPLRATWSVAAELSVPADSQGYFPVTGTVTLDQTAAADTQIQIGAEIYNFGNTQPAPTVVKDMPRRVTVATGQRSTSFDFLVRRIGSPYNVRLWAFAPTGQQVAYPMTVPAS